MIIVQSYDRSQQWGISELWWNGWIKYIWLFYSPFYINGNIMKCSSNKNFKLKNQVK